MSALTRIFIEAMCEDAIGLNSAWTRKRAEQLRDMALRSLEAPGAVPAVAQEPVACNELCDDCARHYGICQKITNIPVRCNPADFCIARHINLYTRPAPKAAPPVAVAQEPFVSLGDLDWERLRSGDRRALDPDNQPLFDRFYAAPAVAHEQFAEAYEGAMQQLAKALEEAIDPASPAGDWSPEIISKYARRLRAAERVVGEMREVLHRGYLREAINDALRQYDAAMLSPMNSGGKS